MSDIPTALQRGTDALHRLQTIIRFTLELAGFHNLPGQVVPSSHEASNKHLRVGVESALASNEAIANLLITKGVLTAEEVAEAIAEQYEVRADAHELAVRAQFPDLRFS